MGLLNRRPAESFYMPKFWPASQILGLILGEQIENVPADKIVGLIVTDQIASLAALKIEGKLTSEQIETIAATQITGELTSEQIAEINAAKIVGQLTDSQLGGIAAAKIIGQLANGQILSLEAGKITGQLTNAQIAALEAAKITGQLTNAQLLGLSAAKIEGLLTSEQIASLAVAKLVGQIVNSQIAAGAVTAGKISVAELSAISVNAGLIEAGTFVGVTFRTTGSEMVLDKNGLAFVRGAAEEVEKIRAIQWLKAAAGEVLGQLYAWGGTETGNIQLSAWPPGRTKRSNLTLSASKTAIQAGALTLQVAGTTGTVNRTVMNDREESHFPQLPAIAKRKMSAGIATINWAGAESTKDIEIEHELGTTPTVVVACNTSQTLGLWQITVDTGKFGATKFTARATFNSGFKPGAGSTTQVSWFAWA